MKNQNLHPTECCKDKIRDTSLDVVVCVLYYTTAGNFCQKKIFANFHHLNFYLPIFSPVLKIT